jgi:hypothetical protein
MVYPEFLVEEEQRYCFTQYPADFRQPVRQELPWRGMGVWAVA